MKIKELILELQKLDPEMPVCAQSETSTWDTEAEDIVPNTNVRVDLGDREFEIYPIALILGFQLR